MHRRILGVLGEHRNFRLGVPEEYRTSRSRRLQVLHTNLVWLLLLELHWELVEHCRNPLDHIPSLQQCYFPQLTDHLSRNQLLIGPLLVVDRRFRCFPSLH